MARIINKRFTVIKEYEKYYLCVYKNDCGKELYKECFLKVEVDGVATVKKEKGNASWYFNRIYKEKR